MICLEHLQEEGFPLPLFAFAYGSGAVTQDGYNPADRPMLDLVFVVENPDQWHRLNLKQNRHHYSIIGSFGSSIVTRVQRFPAGVYYNTLAAMKGKRQKGRLMKYGVIGLSDFQRDLLDWHQLYLAGRLHKPVVLLGGDLAPSGLSTLLTKNLSSALRTSLLFLPDRFSKETLYLTIASLSYSGDFRMHFGENPDKIRNIVLPNLHKFDRLYEPILEKEFSSFCLWNSDSNGMYEQDDSHAAKEHHASLLPLALQMPHGTPFQVSRIRAQLQSIVLRSSLSQSAKGILTAGPTKSAIYAGSKVGKWASWWIRHVGR